MVKPDAQNRGALPLSHVLRRLQAFVFLAALVAASFTGQQAAAGPLLVTDGTFSATSLSSPGGYICQDGSTVGSTCTSNLTDWQGACSISSCEGSSTPGSLLFAGSNNLLIMTAFNGNRGLFGALADPSGGGNAIALDGDPNYASSIFQTVTGLQIGDRYAVTFQQAAAQQQGTTGPTTEQWKVTFGSTSQTSTLMNNASQSVVPWNTQTLDFIATATNETLTFFAVGSPGGEPPVVLLADVSITDMPEPGSLVLLAGGLVAFGVMRRRQNA